MRLAEPDRHLEAITSRPLLLSAIAERSRHARQTTLRVASSHAKAGWAASVLSGIARFLRELVQSAEQLTGDQRWRRILAHAVRSWLGGSASSAASYGAALTGEAHIKKGEQPLKLDFEAVWRLRDAFFPRREGQKLP